MVVPRMGLGLPSWISGKESACQRRGPLGWEDPFE